MGDKIGFIGGGNMAYAIGSGFIRKDLCKAEDVWVSGPHLENLERWKKSGVRITTDNGQVLSECNIVFLAIKPQMLDLAVAQCKQNYQKRGKLASKLVISVLAGVTLQTLTKALCYFDEPRIIRTLPNTPLLVGDGVVLFCCGPSVTEADSKWLESNLGQLGLCELVAESMLDSLGALSGCGPAFMFLVYEALVSGAVGRGVPRDSARRVAARMLRGAGAMLCQSAEHPAQLRDDVTSPGGSTAAGLAQLEKNAIRSAFIQAIDASTDKNILLGEQQRR